MRSLLYIVTSSFMRFYIDPAISYSMFSEQLENFMDWKDEEIGQSILSPSFRVKHTFCSKETKWQIELFPKGHITDALAGTDGQRLPRVSVFLRGISDLRKDHVAVSVSIVDSHLNRIHEEKLQHQPKNTEKLSFRNFSTIPNVG